MLGFTDDQIANFSNYLSEDIRKLRKNGILPVYKMVDTCAGEFEAYTPYFYSTYSKKMKLNLKSDKAIVIGRAHKNWSRYRVRLLFCSCSICIERDR